MRERLTEIGGCLVPLVVCALCLYGIRLETHRGIGYDTPEAAVRGFYKGLQFGNAEEFIDPGIRDAPEGTAILDLYDPTQFSGHFELYGDRHAGKIDKVDLGTIDTVSQTQTTATLRVSGTFEPVADLGTALLKFGDHAIDDTVYLVKMEERWFVRDIEIHSAWFKK